MRIIIVGCGKVGYSIAKSLSEEGHDIIIIDNKLENFDKVVESIDVMMLKGNGLSAKTLREASIGNTDLIISVTNSDETNLLCCLTAKKLGVKYSVARVRDPEYALELRSFKKDLGLDMIINPEQQAALEISRLLRFPSAGEIDTFVGGRVELISYRLEQDSVLLGKSLQHIFSKIKIQVLVVFIKRGNEVIIPHGDTVFQKDDEIQILGMPSNLMEFFRLIGVHLAKIKDAMIIGGGKITYYLAELLAKYNFKMKIVEIDKKKCTKLDEDLEGCVIINADGTNEDVLIAENIQDAGAVVALTDRDEDNVIISLYAMQWKGIKTIVKVNHMNVNMVRNLGFNSVICPKNITSDQIIRYVRGLTNSYESSHIQTMYKLVDMADCRVEALEFDVHTNSKCLDIPLHKLKLKKGILIGCIVRDGQITIASGRSEIQSGDAVIVISKDESLSCLDDILD